MHQFEKRLHIVYLLTDPDRYPTVWSIADIGREMSDQDPMAVVLPLCEAGLLHRRGRDACGVPDGADRRPRVLVEQRDDLA